ncbi:MAG TPA: DUF5985 family protein [Verrucomicrobiae bacterium]|nr:DUF5985 family protein [Verrucomicrobiae bacterium]
MTDIIYGVCAVTAFVCGSLLYRSYHVTKTRLLLWTALCFFGLALNNLLVVADRITPPEFDLIGLRLLAALASMLVLLYGLIFESS